MFRNSQHNQELWKQKEKFCSSSLTKLKKLEAVSNRRNSEKSEIKVKSTENSIAFFFLELSLYFYYQGIFVDLLISSSYFLSGNSWSARFVVNCQVVNFFKGVGEKLFNFNFDHPRFSTFVQSDELLPDSHWKIEFNFADKSFSFFPSKKDKFICKFDQHLLILP